MNETSVRENLARVAELAGANLVPPPSGVFAERRRARRRSVAAVCTAVVAILAVSLTAVVVAGRPHRAIPTPHAGLSGVSSAEPAGHVGLGQLRHYRWSALPPAPIPNVEEGAVSVWTGTEVIIWGGRTASGHAVDTGAAYNPRTKRWRTLPPSPLGRRTDAAYAWTGKQLFVWGGRPHDGRPQGALYDPATNTWRRVATLALSNFNESTAVWTGNRIVLFTAAGASDQRDIYVHAYDPRTDIWKGLQSVRVRQTEVLGINAVVGGDQVYLWADVQTSTPHGGLRTGNDAFAYFAARDEWSSSSLLPPGRDDAVGNPTWTGDHILFDPSGVDCDVCPPPPGQSPGSWADPSTGSVRALPPFRKQVPAEGASYIWTGAAVLGTDRSATKAWRPGSTSWIGVGHAHVGYPAAQVWTGRELIVWGGDPGVGKVFGPAR